MKRICFGFLQEMRIFVSEIRKNTLNSEKTDKCINMPYTYFYYIL